MICQAAGLNHLNQKHEAILGRCPPINAGFYDDSADENLNYYGEVSIQFYGGGAPLLLSIERGDLVVVHMDNHPQMIDPPQRLQAHTILERTMN